VITADQIVAHLIGDYILQSDWMANEKTKKSAAALAHAMTYTLPFLFLTQSPAALAVIGSTHFIIDRWRLARYVCWLKNFLAPRQTENWRGIARAQVPDAPSVWWHSWSECVGTGYHKDKPPWMAVWLLIIADNTLHLLCNGLALAFYP
jgi:hypothetical protein